jgi:hypothetical protein
MTRRALLTFVCAALCCFSASAQPDSERIADQIVRSFVQGRFSDAAMLFYHPPENEDGPNVASLRSLATGLSLMSDELGALSAPKLVPPGGPKLVFAVTSGANSYWDAHPELNRITEYTYETETQVHGTVLLTVSLISVDGKSKARLFSFGMPAERPGAIGAMREIILRLTPKFRRAAGGSQANKSIDTDPQQQEAASPQVLVVRSFLRYPS